MTSNKFDKNSARDAHIRIDFLEEEVGDMLGYMKKSAENTAMIKWLIAGGFAVYTSDKVGILKFVLALM